MRLDIIIYILIQSSYDVTVRKDMFAFQQSSLNLTASKNCINGYILTAWLVKPNCIEPWYYLHFHTSQLWHHYYEWPVNIYLGEIFWSIECFWQQTSHFPASSNTFLSNLIIELQFANKNKSISTKLYCKQSTWRKFFEGCKKAMLF